MVKKLVSGIVMFFIFVILIQGGYSQAQVSYCCEKTTSGAFCQNVPSEDMCDSNYDISPTLCESTSYCKRGCCFDSDEGLCMESTPRSACSSSEGLWEEGANCQIPQCDLGCCIIGTNAAFTTLVRCNRLSALYGLRTNFMVEIQDELECLEMATAQDLGACVYEENFITTCSFGTRGECNVDVIEEGDVQFYKDRLCTDPELRTNCRRTENTKCFDGRVYFIDSCHNKANIYDATKVSNIQYWSEVVPIRDSCRDDESVCGNCDYIGAGTICGAVDKDGKQPEYGKNICIDVNCRETSDGSYRRNGESWCYYDADEKSASVGSVHYLHKCYMGKEYVEACDTFRNFVCFERPIGLEGGGEFAQAGCVPNRWQDCTMQNKSSDCLNTDKRECKWIPIGDPEDIAKGGILTSYKDSGAVLGMILNIQGQDPAGEGRCVPDIPPGLDFWGGTSFEQGAEEVCAVGTQSCIIKYEKGILGGDYKCVENCWCEDPSTAIYVNYICKQYGDCGADSNYIGRFINKGYEIEWGDRTKEPQESRQPANMQRGEPVTGNIIQGFVVRTYNFLKRR